MWGVASLILFYDSCALLVQQPALSLAGGQVGFAVPGSALTVGETGESDNGHASGPEGGRGLHL